MGVGLIVLTILYQGLISFYTDWDKIIANSIEMSKKSSTGYIKPKEMLINKEIKEENLEA